MRNSNWVIYPFHDIRSKDHYKTFSIRFEHFKATKRRIIFLELQISKRCFMLSQRKSCTVFSYNLEFVNREGGGGWSITNINRQIIYENFQEKNKDNSIGSFKVHKNQPKHVIT